MWSCDPGDYGLLQLIAKPKLVQCALPIQQLGTTE